MIGAGPAGLAAGLAAAEAGNDVVILEAGDTVGGMAGSFEVAGQRVDFGSHRLHASTAPRFLDRLQGLLGDDLQARERNGRIRLHGRWVGFPLRTGDMLRHLPPSFTSRVARDTLLAPLRRGGTGDSFEAEVRRRLGPTVSNEFYMPYATKLYGVDPTTLETELADRRVSASSTLSVLRTALAARRVSGRTFFYPRQGYGQVSEALADAAVAAGAELRLGEAVTFVAHGPEPSVQAGDTAVDADIVLSSMPIQTLLGSLQAPPPKQVIDVAARLRTRAMVLVYLVVEQPQYSPFDAHYFPTLDFAVSRVSEPKNYRTGDDPPDTTVLCAELPCWRDDDTWSASDHDLAERVAGDLIRAGLPAPCPVEVAVRRLGSVYPVFEHATAVARQLVDAWLAGLDGVVSFGRQGLGVPDNLHHVLAMGEAAAAATTGGDVDRPAWRRSLTSFADHVVVD